ncbi:hypothetical protein FB004_106234 [Sinorhizobium medicae]|nr:hypothetical protein FB004_106234 [Sinorhizobium medicae]TWA25456.1 hypothetical protein FB006_105112 [Sinorhizobium medicae]TWA36268.1 hypothetical protein FB007_105112 [Sinorhizobium medicae]TWA38530.1 hypothetical protein FB009_107112 [Sinorhizobium medicae]TWA45136.1 hypothetical protein FB005_106233 [Sinorhizobium medicae]
MNYKGYSARIEFDSEDASSAGSLVSTMLSA